jgi:hypothetical protein
MVQLILSSKEQWAGQTLLDLASCLNPGASMSRRTFLHAAAAIAASLLAMPAAAGPAATPAGETLAALYPCTTGFFKALETHKAAFGPVTVRDLDSRTAGAPDKKKGPKQGPRTHWVLGRHVTFASAIEAQGLHLTGYWQVQITRNTQLHSFSWGFRVAEPPATIAAQIKTTVPDADFREQGSAFGWAQELDPVWRRTGPSTIETQLPLRLLLIEPSRDPSAPGSTIRCIVHKSKTEPMTALPDISALFVIAP